MIESERREDLVRKEVERLLQCITEGADHYKVLNVSKDATVDVIRVAYCKAVEYLHPLKCRDLIEKDGALRWKLSQAFLRVVEAFSTLSRYARRIEYDSGINRGPVVPLPEPPSILLSSVSEGKTAVANVFGRRAPSLPKTHDRRRAIRFAMRLPVRVTARDGSWQEVTVSRDVSSLGIRFSLAHALEQGTLVRLELPMPKDLRTHSHTSAVYVVGAVVRHAVDEAGKSNLVGAEFMTELGAPIGQAASLATSS